MYFFLPTIPKYRLSSPSYFLHLLPKAVLIFKASYNTSLSLSFPLSSQIMQCFGIYGHISCIHCKSNQSFLITFAMGLITGKMASYRFLFDIVGHATVLLNFFPSTITAEILKVLCVNFF